MIRRLSMSIRNPYYLKYQSLTQLDMEETKYYLMVNVDKDGTLSFLTNSDDLITINGLLSTLEVAIRNSTSDVIIKEKKIK